MEPERWKQVSRLFKSAVERGPAERAAYLEEACAGDAELRREVEALVGSHERAEGADFIGGRAVEEAASLLDAAGAGLRAGERVGHYEVVEKLGAGGMGEVYLARDLVLEREAALKILPPDIAPDRERLRRFEREAKAASALNHPNILTVYEVGEAGPLRFIVTELVRGTTLRERIRRARVETPELLDIAAQAASALATAHEEGIVHRDIKPENIMLRADGYVKVLDFGIAKLAARPKAVDTEAETASLLRTAPGQVLGTVGYMSPEQVRGREVDARTDIWSLGVVLYEMLTGRQPFPGETHSDVISVILQKEPAPLAEAAPGAPEELRRIITKTLAKERERRYRTARELEADLKGLKRRLEFEAELERSTPPLRDVGTAAAVPVLRRRGPVAALAAATLLAAVVFGVLFFGNRRPAEPSAADPSAAVSAGSPPTAAPAPGRSLSYWITVQRPRGGRPEPFRLPGEILFEAGDRIRLHVSVAQGGHLYVLNEGPTPGAPLNVLFPTPTANAGSPVIDAGGQVQIPEESWFSFDRERGTEKVWLVWAAEAVAELEAARRFVNPRERGEIRDEPLNRALREFIASHAAPPPEVRKDEAARQTNVAGRGDVLVHPIPLLHF